MRPSFAVRQFTSFCHGFFLLAASTSSCLANSSNIFAQHANQAVEASNSIPEIISENLGNLLTLEVRDDRLKPVICTDYQIASNAFQTMGSQSSGGSSGGGQAQWQCYRDNPKWTIAGQYGMRLDGTPIDKADPQLEFAFIDKTDPGWRLKVTARDDGQVYFLAYKKNDASCTYLWQRPDGSLSVFGILPDRILAASAANLGQLLKSQPQTGNDVLLPALRNWGLSRTSGRFSSEVRNLLLRKFATPDEEAQQAFEKAISELSASLFETRESASAWLKENSQSHIGLILDSLLNPELPPEPRARLRKTLEAALSKSEFETLSQIEKQSLAEDPEILIWLVAETHVESTRDNIFRSLVQLTGQALGNDLTAWRAWLAKSGKQAASTNNVSAAPVEPASYPRLQGPLLDVSTTVAELLPLTVIKGKIQLDRVRWAERYDGKSVKELGDELRQFVIDRKLPMDWVNVERDSMDGIDYPHLVFPRLETKLEQTSDPGPKKVAQINRFRQPRLAEPSKNLTIQSNQLRASLEVDEGSHLTRNMYFNGEPKKQALVITLSDETNSANTVIFGRWPDGATRIIVASPTSLVQIFQAADGKCRLDCAVENQSFHREFGAADQMLAEPHFKEKVAEYLQQYGLQFLPAMNKTAQRP